MVIYERMDAFLTLFGKCLAVYLLILNLIAFILCGLDKWKAQHERWRVPERVLFGVSFLGGGLCFFIGMQLFRHKTKHWSFKILIPLSILLWLGIILFIQIKFGVLIA